MQNCTMPAACYITKQQQRENIWCGNGTTFGICIPEVVVAEKWEERQSQHCRVRVSTNQPKEPSHGIMSRMVPKLPTGLGCRVHVTTRVVGRKETIPRVSSQTVTGRQNYAKLQWYCMVVVSQQPKEHGRRSQSMLKRGEHTW